MAEPSPAPPPRRRPSSGIVRLAWVFYLPMALSGVFARSPGALHVADASLLGYGVAAALAGAAAVIAASRWLARRTGWGRALREEFRATLGPLSSRQILVLSLLSAFGEEMLFRGVLQAWLGLWWTALVFGMFHVPVRRRLIPWSLFAGALGVALGALTQWSLTVWPAVVLHFAINYFNLHDLVEENGT